MVVNLALSSDRLKVLANLSPPEVNQMHTLVILGAVLAARGPGCVGAAVFGVAGGRAGAEPPTVGRPGERNRS
jgi:hypothetical protein